MSSEIKIVYSDAYSAVKSLELNTLTFDPLMPENIGGNNVMDVMTGLNDLNSALYQTLKFYKSLLYKNCEATKSAIQYMEETDQQTAASIEKR